MEPAVIAVEHGRIAGITRGRRAPGIGPIVDAPIVSAGFIDLQVNGGYGVDVASGTEAIRRLSRCLPRTGVTSYLPTVISTHACEYPSLLSAFRQAAGGPGADAMGLHLEGPFLSPSRPGAHDPGVLTAARPDLYDSLALENTVSLVTLAPERPGALDLIRRLRARGVMVSLGHTDATFEQLEEGIDAGAVMVTHLFNAMRGFSHRAPGALGAALIDDRVVAGFIADGIHTHPAAASMLLRAKGMDGVVLVTDMISAAGMPPGTYPLGRQCVRVDAESARLLDGTLAGSMLTMDLAVRNMIRWTGAGLAEVLRLATAVPAAVMGVSDRGRIREGLRADFTLMDDSLRVIGTIVGGRRVYSTGDTGPECAVSSQT
jgi:N-acetylglucosamine-6-phosphate deacetylase